MSAPRTVMAETETLLGFDCRIPRATLQRGLSQRYRDGFLYRTDCLAPLSVDTMIWPCADRELNWGELRDYQNYFPDFSDSLALAEEIATRSGAELIAVTIERRNWAPSDEAPWKKRIIDKDGNAVPDFWSYVAVDPPELNQAWRPLGYDVADNWVLSGLMNCGLDPDRDDVAVLRARWAPPLNSHHLFNRFEDADEFRAFANSHAPEHAPFFVYRMYTR